MALLKMNKPFCYRFDHDTNIRDLPGSIIIKLRNILDIGPQDSNWRAFAALLTKPYELSHGGIEKLSLRVYIDGSPSDQMFLELGGKGFNIKDLADIVNQLGIEKVLIDLVKSIPLEITKEPIAYLKISEGSEFSLSVEAFGLPYPRYQWFHGDVEIQGATEATLHIDDACQKGSYWCQLPTQTLACFCCRLHNCKDPTKVLFTEVTEVQIIPMSSDEDHKFSEELNKPNNNPPHFPIICQHPSSKSVFLGNSVSLECEATGSPVLNYTWFHNDEFFTETNSTHIHVDNATEFTNGQYHCLVQNSFGQARSRYARIIVENGSNYPSCAKIPEILTHPKSCSVEMEGVALFCCEAQGTRPITYQWFKNGEAIQGSNTSELKLRNINREHLGIYQCLVTNTIGCKLSQGALLQVSTILETKQLPAYTATDKVALLIGNYEYRCEDKLKAPKTDIQNLSEIFSSLGFKVMSLLNLTLIEIKNAVDHFCELLGPGVYGVFYFCGHGFEEKKEIYLVPQDAPTGYLTNHCLPSDYVQSRMQKNQPQMSCLILDVCRTPNKIMSPDLTKAEDVEVMTSANTVFLYATSEGNQAFEYSSHGLLVRYLQKYLPTMLSIEEVIAKVREEFGNAILPGDKIQNPQVKSNLTQPRRSFSDQIVYKGHTQEFCDRQMAWEHCIDTPKDMILKALPLELGIVLQLQFHADFANVLTVFVTVKDMGITSKCIAWIGKHPNTISTMSGTPVDVTEHVNRSQTKNTLQDIQKLKDKLEVSIYIKYKLNTDDNLISDKTTIQLGFPLVSRLLFWKDAQVPVTFRREATEQDDNMS